MKVTERSILGIIFSIVAILLGIISIPWGIPGIVLGTIAMFWNWKNYIRGKKLGI